MGSEPSRPQHGRRRDGSQVGAAIFPEVTGGGMWQNRDAIVTNGIGARRPGSFVNGTSAYVRENGVESLLVSEAPRPVATCSATG